jgi:hypothetical protein
MPPLPVMPPFAVPPLAIPPLAVPPVVTLPPFDVPPVALFAPPLDEPPVTLFTPPLAVPPEPPPSLGESEQPKQKIATAAAAAPDQRDRPGAGDEHVSIERWVYRRVPWGEEGCTSISMSREGPPCLYALAERRELEPQRRRGHRGSLSVSGYDL